MFSRLGGDLALEAGRKGDEVSKGLIKDGCPDKTHPRPRQPQAVLLVCSSNSTNNGDNGDNGDNDG
jgi:hypothetical protein